MDNAQNPTGPVLTAAESRRRVLHNMCSSLLYNLSVILFGLLLPRLYLTSFGSELNGLDSTIKQIFSCLALLRYRLCAISSPQGIIPLYPWMPAAESRQCLRQLRPGFIRMS